MSSAEHAQGGSVATLVESLIHDIAHYLPCQGPVRTFVHHNTLHHFEQQEFFDAVETASRIYGSHTALPESSYQQLYTQGRIDESDINRALAEDELDGSPWLHGVSRRKIVRSLLFSAPITLTAETLRWRLLEKGYLTHFSSDLPPRKIAHIREASESTTAEQELEWTRRYRDVVTELEEPWLLDLAVAGLNAETHDDSRSLRLLWIAAVLYADRVILRHPSFSYSSNSRSHTTLIEETVNPYIIKFTSSFLDGGLAYLTVADRGHGLLHAFLTHLENSSATRIPWLTVDCSEYRGRSSAEIIAVFLETHNVPQERWHDQLMQKSLILKGWGGIVHQSEIGVPGIATKATLTDFLAIRFILEESAERYFKKHPADLLETTETLTAGTLTATGAGSSPERLHRANNIRITAYHLFHAFQLCPFAARELLTIPESDQEALVTLIATYAKPRRLRIWHKAYEWNLYTRTATALLDINKEAGARSYRDSLVQLVCCIDDREESFRRYIEELNPHYETFGTAGFFGVDAEFHSIYERPAPYCPVNVIPTHQVAIKPKLGSEQRLLGVKRMKTARADIEMFFETHSRSLVRGWLLALGGLLALVPLSLSTLAPRFMHRFRLYIKRVLINPTDESAVVFAQDDAHDEEGLYTLDEMAHRVRTMLITTGLAKRLAPIVVVMGHGSFSTNNPYRSAYDCGACGGRPGRMNPRVFALMANRPDVRAKVRESGLDIPDSTHFIGAFHNTCTDAVEYFDTDLLAEGSQKIFERFRADVDTARAQNALERCRRFADTVVNTVDEAIAHVESRAHHIAQPRPEYGHATNAIAIVGRRSISKGLFLDRRSFLISYDKTVDPEASALRNLLRAVIPVCMGISLEYLFSAIDNHKFGAGTKLPHNVTSLLGLMTGYCSDLRTGLPAQMVEIHEPTRLLVVIDQEPAAIEAIIDSEVDVGRAVKNHWVTLMAYSAEQNQLFYYDHTNRFVRFDEPSVGIQTVSSSLAWVAGKKDHLDFVRIGS